MKDGKPVHIFKPTSQSKRDKAPQTFRLQRRFESRFDRQSLTFESLAELRDELLAEVEEADHPSDGLLAAAAMTQLQVRPDEVSIRRARMLLARLTQPTGHDRLFELVRMMESNTANNTRGFRLNRINWSISNICPMVCEGCYNPFTGQTVSLDQAFAIVDVLDRAGVSSVMLTGGDPLLWEGLERLVERLVGKNITVGLDTTASGDIANRLRSVMPLIETVGLPMDATVEQTSAIVRRGAAEPVVNSVRHVLRSDWVRNVRIHTIVSRANIEELPRIAAEIGTYPAVKEWALYQFWPRRASQAIDQSLSVPDQDFRQATARIHVPGVEIFPYPFAGRTFTNAIVLANGEVATAGQFRDEEFILGSLLDKELDEILSSPAVCQTRLIQRLLAGSGEQLFDAPR